MNILGGGGQAGDTGREARRLSNSRGITVQCDNASINQPQRGADEGPPPSASEGPVGPKSGIRGWPSRGAGKECRAPLPSRSPHAGAGAASSRMGYGAAEAAGRSRRAAGVDTKPHGAPSLGLWAGTPGRTGRWGARRGTRSPFSQGGRGRRQPARGAPNARANFSRLRRSPLSAQRSGPPPRHPDLSVPPGLPHRWPDPPPPPRAGGSRHSPRPAAGTIFRGGEGRGGCGRVGGWEGAVGGSGKHGEWGLGPLLVRSRLAGLGAPRGGAATPRGWGDRGAQRLGVHQPGLPTHAALRGGGGGGGGAQPGPRPEPGSRRVAARVPAGPASSAPQSRTQGAPRSARAAPPASRRRPQQQRRAGCSPFREHRKASGQGARLHRVASKIARAGRGRWTLTRSGLALPSFHTHTPPAPRWRRSCSRCHCRRRRRRSSRRRCCRLGWARSRDAARGEPGGGQARARAEEARLGQGLGPERRGEGV